MKKDRNSFFSSSNQVSYNTPNMMPINPMMNYPYTEANQNYYAGPIPTNNYTNDELNERLSKIERQLNRLENRISKLENDNPNNYSSSMYMV